MASAHVAEDVDVVHRILEDQLMQHAIAEVACSKANRASMQVAPSGCATKPQQCYGRGAGGR